MHARIDGGKATLLTRTGLDWSQRYRRTVEALQRLPVKSAHFDGELCALNADGVPVFSRLQVAMGEAIPISSSSSPSIFCSSTVRAPRACRWSSARQSWKRLFRKKIDGLLDSDHVVGRPSVPRPDLQT